MSSQPVFDLEKCVLPKTSQWSKCSTWYITSIQNSWTNCFLNLQFLKNSFKKQLWFPFIPLRNIIRSLIRDEKPKPLFLTLPFIIFSFPVVVVLLLKRNRDWILCGNSARDFFWKTQGFTSLSHLSFSIKQVITWVPNSAFQAYVELFQAS